MTSEFLVQYLPFLALASAAAVWALSFFTAKLAWKCGAVDEPDHKRKMHENATPLFGGAAVAAVILAGLALLLAFSGFESWFASRSVHVSQILGFGFAVVILTVGGVLDDAFDLRPRTQILFPLAAALVVIGTGTTIGQVTNWFAEGGYSLVWGTASLGPLKFSFPADLVTLIWLLAVTYATKLLDGLNGLVSGQAGIGAGVIGALALSAAYFQPEVAVLAVLVGAAFLGFLPRNMFPAKQFLGESGSTIAGFSLGFLAILGGAKLATAFMVLGLPLLDAGMVVTGRILRGVSPWVGDRTHLHFKLLKAGLSQRQAVLFLWTLALLFGLAALGLQTTGKILLVCTLAGIAVLLSVVTGMMQKERSESAKSYE